MSRAKAADLALLFNTVVWGSTFVLVRTALADISPLLFLALRFSLATVVLVALFRKIWQPPFNWRAAAAGGLAGTFLFGGYLLQTLGLRLTTAPKSAFLTGLTSVWVPLLAALVYRVRPQLSEVSGLFLALAGMGLMTVEGRISSIGLINRGDLLTFGCAIAFAAHILTLARFSERFDFQVLAVTQIAAAAGWSVVLFQIVEPPRVEWHPSVVYAILITGILATAMAFTIQAWAQQYTTATRTALIFMLEPVFAWLTSYWLAGEGLTARAAAGAILILGGVLVVELKPLNPRTSLID